MKKSKKGVEVGCKGRFSYWGGGGGEGGGKLPLFLFNIFNVYHFYI